MSLAGPGETSMASPRKPDSGFPDLLRVAALIAVGLGAGGSFALMLRAGRRTPRFLLVAFVFWVLSPFAGLAWACVVSQRWSVPTRNALYCVTLFLTLASLAIYAQLIRPPAGSPGAFVFVIVPPASWLVMTIVVSIAALTSRRRSYHS